MRTIEDTLARKRENVIDCKYRPTVQLYLDPYIKKNKEVQRASLLDSTKLERKRIPGFSRTQV